jgi:predicted DNA-binding protein (UPF0251 family)
MTKLLLNYEEREALRVIRKYMQRKPEIAAALMEGMAKEVAVNVLLQAKKELDQLLAINRAFIAVAGELAKIDKEQPCETST